MRHGKLAIVGAALIAAFGASASGQQRSATWTDWINATLQPRWGTSYDTNRDTRPDTFYFDRNRDTRPDAVAQDRNGDGWLDTVWVDANFNGRYEYMFQTASVVQLPQITGARYVGYCMVSKDLNEDGQWDQLLLDVDGSGSYRLDPVAYVTAQINAQIQAAQASAAAGRGNGGFNIGGPNPDTGGINTGLSGTITLGNTSRSDPSLQHLSEADKRALADLQKVQNSYPGILLQPTRYPWQRY